MVMRKRPTANLKLSVSVAARMRSAGLVRFLGRHLRAAHRILRPALAELSVVLVDDRTMAGLHERFMNLAGPTDVLTFPIDEDARGRTLSGEVVVCVPEARRRARELGVAVDRELLLYALHGMLHLCGFDDRTASGFAAMHRTEDDILTRLGVGPVFEPLRKAHRQAGPSGISAAPAEGTRRASSHRSAPPRARVKTTRGGAVRSTARPARPGRKRSLKSGVA